MSNELQKPVIGFSCGDLNGIGIELIIKALNNSHISELFTAIVFANNKSINFYAKTIQEGSFTFNLLKDLNKPNPKQINIYNCWEGEVTITPGQMNETGGKHAYLSLQAAVEALKAGQIQGLVTAPIHKKTIQSEAFNYSGHTPFLKDSFKVNDVAMLMVAENMRVAVLTEHVPVKDITKYITKEAIISKLEILHKSLQQDFGVSKPKIAVLGLNPHAGDEGLIGDEEERIIKPAIKEAKTKGIFVFGPYSADAFFARAQYEKFDAVLAMYHDQGLIPFKSLALGEGVNYTAGLPIVRTSPDHGTAFDIAGKDRADASSFLASIFTAIDIIRARQGYADDRKNPIRKMSGRMLANAVDEKIEEGE